MPLEFRVCCSSASRHWAFLFAMFRCVLQSQKLVIHILIFRVHTHATHRKRRIHAAMKNSFQWPNLFVLHIRIFADCIREVLGNVATAINIATATNPVRITSKKNQITQFQWWNCIFAFLMKHTQRAASWMRWRGMKRKIERGAYRMRSIHAIYPCDLLMTFFYLIF